MSRQFQGALPGVLRHQAVGDKKNYHLQLQSRNRPRVNPLALCEAGCENSKRINNTNSRHIL
jgi:hypothetical protein